MTSPRFGTRPASVEDEPAQRVDFFLVAVRTQLDTVPLFERLDRSAGIGDQGAVSALDQARRLGVVVLVLDLADDFLDQILDRDQPVDAAELVDDHRDMGARLAHLHEQIEDRQRRRDEQQLAQKRRQLGLAPLGDRRAAVLDVDKADYVVERLAIDWHPRMSLLDHAFDDIGERGFDDRVQRCRRAAPSRRQRYSHEPSECCRSAPVHER